MTRAGSTDGAGVRHGWLACSDARVDEVRGRCAVEGEEGGGGGEEEELCQLGDAGEGGGVGGEMKGRGETSKSKGGDGG